MALELRQGFTVLRQRNVSLLLGSQAISLIGDGLFTVALAFATLEVAGRASALGLVLAAGLIPLVALLAVAGVWADRLSRRRLMVSSDFARAAIQLTLAALLITGTAHLWQLVVLNALYGCATAFFQPSAVGLLPEIVDQPDDLTKVNGFSNIIRSGMSIVGSAVGGVLVDLTSPGTAIAVDAVSFLASAGIVALIHIPTRPAPASATPPAATPPAATLPAVHPSDALGAPHIDPPASGRSFRRELAEGWSEVRSRRWLWVVIANASLFLLCYVGPLQVVGPIVARTSYGGATAWGLIMGALSAGMALGGLIAMTVPLRRPMLLSCYGMLITTFTPLTLAFGLPLPVVIAAFIIEGTSVGLFIVTWESALQREIPADRLSRVAAWDWTGSLLGMPIGMLLAGPVIALVGTTHLLWFMGLACGALAIWMLALPDVRAIGARTDVAD